MNSQKLANFFNILNFEINEFESYVIYNFQIKFPNSNIYYKPNINGDIPDILIIEENKGVILIDICTFKLNEYTLNDEYSFKNKVTNDIRLSPIKKLTNYKNNLFKYHIDGFLEAKIKSKNKLYRTIKNIVIFKYETVQSIYNFFKTNEIKYTKLLSKDNFLDIYFKRDTYFTNNFYKSFLDILSSKNHKKENGISLNYSKRQKELSISKKGQFKIRGVAGAGKTYILAKRAVNSHLRHKQNVLILTYNKSLKQYIIHKLNEIQEDFNYQFFHIDNYHNFIEIIKNNLSVTDQSNMNTINSNFPKFNSIFIDEVQDFKTEWIRFIKMYLLSYDGELVVFGDEKQNIYDRELDKNKKINTTIPGRWNELKDSFRFNGIIVDLTNNFQKEFLSQKYEISNIQKQSLLNFSEEYIEYLFFDKNTILKELAYTIHLKINNDNLNLKDVSIIGSRINFLQNLDELLRTELNRKTQTTFVTKGYLNKYGNKKEDITNIERYKKNKFDIYSESIKLSTINSFKGYESKTLFFIITSDDVIDEVIYTAFTRAVKNLYIINIGNTKYDNFFKNNIINMRNIQTKLTDEIKQSIDTYDESESDKLRAMINDLENKYKIQKEIVNKTKSENDTLKLEIDNSLNEINQIGTIVKYSKELENLLVKLGANEYLDFIDKIKFIEHKLEDTIINDLHEIRQYRNKVVHNTTVINNFTYFINKCKSMINILENKI